MMARNPNRSTSMARCRITPRQVHPDGHPPRRSASGTPFISFFTPTEMLALARDAGFRDVRHVSAAALAQRYFADRTDGLRPPDNSEELLVATT
jgi:hypothetical protein